MAYLSLDDRSIYYDIVDLTPPWVRAPQTILFHHGVAASAEIWADWLPALIGRYRLVRFDMRGCGRSEKGDARAAIGFESMLGDLLALADAVEANRFHLVGESIGGSLALLAALRQPQRVRSVTGVSCSHRGSGVDNVVPWRVFIDEHGMAGWSEMMMARRFHPGALPDARHAWYQRQQSEQDPDVVLALAQALLDLDLSPELDRLTQPVLLLSPDDSPFIGPTITAELHRLLPDSEMQVFAGTRHGLPFSHARPCAAATADFLARRFEN
ncbi:MAG: alpha/beta hydrolase [Alphaproteobacteria bacterium]